MDSKNMVVVNFGKNENDISNKLAEMGIKDAKIISFYNENEENIIQTEKLKCSVAAVKQPVESEIDKLSKCVDIIIIVPSGVVTDISEEDAEILSIDDRALIQGVKHIKNIIWNRGMLNYGIDDLERFLDNSQTVYMGIGIGKGEEAVKNAANDVIRMFDVINKDDIHSICLNIAGNENTSLIDVANVTDMIHNSFNATAKVMFGLDNDKKINDEFEITMLAANERMINCNVKGVKYYH